MINFFKDIVTYEFLRNSMLASTLVGFSVALISPIVVYKKMEFIGDGTAHAAFAGLAIGVLTGYDYRWVAVASAVLFSITIGYLTNKSKITENSAIGMLLPVFMSIGVIILSMSARYTQDVMGYLFGNILFVEIKDVWFLFVMTLITLFVIIYFKYEILYFLSDENMAEFYGVNVKAIRILLLVLISIIVVSSVKITGIILISALIVIPGLISKKFSKSYKNAIIISVFYSVIMSTVGLIIAYYFDVPPGPSIVLSYFAVFLLVFLFKN